MCGIFGFLDYKHQIGNDDKNYILRKLAFFSQLRGIDAIGYACTDGEHLSISKRNGPAYKYNYSLQMNSSAAIGHCRLSTSRSDKSNRNNHPFKGNLKREFALIHNGMVFNHKQIKRKYNLPESRIITDSYVLAQLLEKHNMGLNHNAIKYTMKDLKGTFAVAILDTNGTLFLIKKGSPLYCIKIAELGIYIFSSRKIIMTLALFGFLRKYNYKEVKIAKNEAVCIYGNGKIIRAAV